MYEPKFYFCITHELIINISVSSLSDDTASTIILKKIKIRIKSKPLTIAFCDFICVTDSFPRFCGPFVFSIFLLSQLGSQNYCQINFHIRHELHQPLPPALPLPPSPLRRWWMPLPLPSLLPRRTPSSLPAATTSNKMRDEPFWCPHPHRQ